MDGENLRRPEKPDRLGDIPHGMFEHCVDKLAEACLSRKSFERLGNDWQYAGAVAGFMCHGYDQLEATKKAKRELEERRKSRRRWPNSNYNDDGMQKFCNYVLDDSRTFVRTAGWSFVQALALKDEGHSPIRKVISPERVKAFAELLPEPDAKRNRGIKASEIVADALLYACNIAVRFVCEPGGYLEYAKEMRHGGIGIGQRETVTSELKDLVTVDPVLFLQLTATDLCRLITVGRGPKKTQGLKALIDEYAYLDESHCPEIDTGKTLFYYFGQAIEWRSEQGGYPDPLEYWSLGFCCRRMENLKTRPTERSGLAGNLGKGFRMILWKDPNTKEDEVWFKKCPFCEKDLHTPTGVKLYDHERDYNRFRIYR